MAARPVRYWSQMTGYSLCNTTISPIMPNIAVFIHGFSDNMIVTYPTNGM